MDSKELNSKIRFPASKAWITARRAFKVEILDSTLATARLIRRKAQGATTSMPFQRGALHVHRRKVVERCPGGPSWARVILVDWRGTIIRLVSASWGWTRGVKRAIFFLRKYHRSLLHLSYDLSSERSFVRV